MTLSKHFFYHIAMIACGMIAVSRVGASDLESLQPLMATEGEIAIQNDFSNSTPLRRTEWQKRQGTRWAIKNGVLQGRPSTKEYQTSKPHHKGLEARVSCPITPHEFIATFSVRFLDGAETRIVPFIEFGHHIVRIKFSKSGISLVADGETLLLDEAKDFHYRPGHWYHILAEMKDEEFVIQFANGPTLYARHPSFKQPATKGGVGLGIAGPWGGRVELDSLTMWHILEDEQPNWRDTQKAMPQFERQILKQKKKQK